MARIAYMAGRQLAMLLPLAWLLCGGCRSGSEVARSTAAFPVGRGFVRHQLTLDGRPHTLWIFVPRDYCPGRKYPAILFLHGLFEAGRGTDAALSAGLGPVIADRKDSWPFITIFPQSPGTWKGEARQRLAMAALHQAEQMYSIDPDRVILAGLSYGALGTWQLAARHPDRFAALVPVSGHRATELVERVAMLPVWAFAVTGDLFVDADNSREMCDEIAALGGRPRFTRFRGIGHDCWDRAIAQSDLVGWMLAQRRRSGDSGMAGAGE
ncbi:MAG: alpha/beta hydrolase-fold protein [Phycisphaerales bacterium]|nr:alpha/beta hydrolase-fold protein [Phycisphaerales bacterium]